ncbi:dolichyl-phosphate-mannose-protein mannosyltransferase [Methylophaga lonarensis MPL]|uniref:Dolichyl-phosphate-mannose-protein mannosyltransferase n=1 Tax=Methylophaga lonarensis MPL TaxID=1286106 RepID=M7P400_9GAMM|nr:glycosyltransferase family 39 protein [Methylophaga lonarensis]EMR14237.1 dolichyl-phosphate-mannose-protein mannosyltransferase [Methylophaga lonarensis MPL]
MQLEQMKTWHWWLLITLLATLIFTVRALGPVDLEGWAQHRNVGYVMDMMWQGSWLAQYDIQGRILSKPPLHTWTIAPFAAVLGVDRLAMILPAFLSVLVLSWLVFFEGRRRFGLLAGAFAALAVILSPMMLKHIALVRSDPMFALGIAAAAFIAFRAWETGRGWIWFWVIAGLATLIKGPLGLILAGAGLLAYFWEKRTDSTTPALRGRQWPGVIAFFAISLSWFLLALWQQGYELIDKMFFDELIGQAAGTRKDSIPGENLPKPTLFLLLRFLPFSLFFFYGLWCVFRRPADNAAERRFERFLTVWVLTGLLIFSLAAHHRADLLLPLWPACALIAGREMVRFMNHIGQTKFVSGLVVVALLVIGGSYNHYHHPTGKRAENVEYAAQMQQAAAIIQAEAIDVSQLQHMGTATLLQMYLGTFHQWLDLPQLYQMLEAQGEVLLAVEPWALELLQQTSDLQISSLFDQQHALAETPVMIVRVSL